MMRGREEMQARGVRRLRGQGRGLRKLFGAPTLPAAPQQAEADGDTGCERQAHGEENNGPAEKQSSER